MMKSRKSAARTSVATGRVYAPGGEARRALVLHDRPLVVDLITLTLNHGVFTVRAARTMAEADAILTEWPPHMAVVDMDHDDSSALLGRLGASNSLTRSVTPVLGLTRRGDLKTKLRAFDLGVDDILAMPFSPEELLARSIVLTRRASGTDRPIIPTIRLGEIEVDILNRVVHAGSSIIHLSGIEQSLLYLLAKPRRTSREPRGHPRRDLGHRLRRREQHRRPSHPEPANQASERLPPPALHREGPGPGLPVHPHVLEPGLGRRAGRPGAPPRLSVGQGSYRAGCRAASPAIVSVP
jgi:DNA-binding response OmpR family regulator